MVSDCVHFISLMDLAAALRRGELTPTRVTEALLSRINRFDGTLNSYTTLLADRAMAKAREAEAELNSGFYRGPLHGVPIAVKDLCYTSYAPTSAGMFIHKDFVPPFDATVVERLERAGAIILGKLSMTEGAYATHHPKMLTPVNPWHPDVWTGSSSSGSGAATAGGALLRIPWVRYRRFDPFPLLGLWTDRAEADMGPRQSLRDLPPVRVARPHSGQ